MNFLDRFVSFRFVGFDAGRPLVSGTSFWGFRSNVPNQWLPRTHWAAWSIRQEGSTPVVIHLDKFPPTNFNLLLRATVLLYLFFFKIEQQYHLHILANIGFEYEYEPLDELIATPPFTRCACYFRYTYGCLAGWRCHAILHVVPFFSFFLTFV